MANSSNNKANCGSHDTSSMSVDERLLDALLEIRLRSSDLIPVLAAPSRVAICRS